MTKNRFILIFVTWGVIMFILGHFSNCNRVPKCNDVQTSPVTTLIDTKQKAIDTTIKRIEVVKSSLKPIKANIVSITDKLTSVKAEKDTVMIIVIQDSLINVQRLEIKTLENVILLQDNVIDGQRGIIELKDVQIASMDLDSKEDKKQMKKFKRQRNGAIAASIGIASVYVYEKVKQFLK